MHLSGLKLIFYRFEHFFINHLIIRRNILEKTVLVRPLFANEQAVLLGYFRAK